MSKANLPILMDVLCETYDDPALREEVSGVTHCDAAVGYILAKCGFKDYLPDRWTANLMVEDMRVNQLFKRINGSRDAQRLANKGVLVVAGLQIQPHGHVAVLRPGVPEWSNTWGRLAPKGMSVGAETATFIGKKLSWAFRKEPEYFALRSTNDAV
jgi:hypothetical protein